ncbi:MAG: hypothetical protein ACRER2_07780 [Methylococcales bacterium]
MIRQQGPLPFEQIARKKVTTASHEIASIIGHQTTPKKSLAEEASCVGRFRVSKPPLPNAQRNDRKAAKASLKVRVKFG